MKLAVFDEEGFPVGFYDEGVHGKRKIPVYSEVPDATDDEPDPTPQIVGYEENPDCIIPGDAIEITDSQWSEFLENQGLRKWEDGRVVEYTPPHIEPVTILPAVTLWERTSKTEAAQIEVAMETQDARSRNIFRTAQTFRSDHELWPLLEQLATQLFGEERAAELLAP